MHLSKAYIMILGLLICGSWSCWRTNSHSNLVVSEVISGNTLQMSNGKVMSLIGVEDTKAAAQFLNKELLHEPVTFRYDSRYNSFNDQVYVYLTRRRDQLAVNREVLLANHAELEVEYLHDSLALFKAYAKGNTGPRRKREPRDPGIARAGGEKLTDVVKRNEAAVFLVITRDKRGKILGTGTGFFIQEEGIGISNYHVFEGGASWEVKLLNGAVLEVTDILVEKSKNDFIVFEVNDGLEEVRALTLGSGEVDKGEEVIVIGNPKGLESTLTKGHISSGNRTFDGVDLIQIDAAISPGSSGSPVMTTDGIVIGVATMQFNDCENCNFAINIDDVKRALRRNNVAYYD